MPRLLMTIAAAPDNELEGTNKMAGGTAGVITSSDTASYFSIAPSPMKMVTLPSDTTVTIHPHTHTQFLSC